MFPQMFRNNSIQKKALALARESNIHLCFCQKQCLSFLGSYFTELHSCSCWVHLFHIQFNFGMNWTGEFKCLAKINNGLSKTQTSRLNVGDTRTVIKYHSWKKTWKKEKTKNLLEDTLSASWTKTLKLKHKIGYRFCLNLCTFIHCWNWLSA